jgi:hypothetical protein
MLQAEDLKADLTRGLFNVTSAQMAMGRLRANVGLRIGNKLPARTRL